MIYDNSAFANLTPCPEPGIYENILNEDYHKIDCPSSSWLKDLVPPARLPASLLKPKQDKSDALLVGEATHQQILEPDLFASRFVRMPDFGDGRTKAAKDAKAAFENENVGKICMKPDDYDLAIAMRDSVYSNEDAKSLLELRTATEASIIADEPNTGVRCRVRPDLLLHSTKAGKILIGDIKTTAKKASRKGFEKTILEYQYHISAAMYLELAKKHYGVEVSDFFFIVIEKTYPYFTAVWRLSDELGCDALQIGRDKMVKNLLIYKECREKNYWPMYETGDISLPGYYHRKIELGIEDDE